MFKSHLQAVNWCDVLHMVTLCLNENKLMANEKGFCITAWRNPLDHSAPKWTFQATEKASTPMCKSTHGARALGGSDVSYGDKWNKMISSKLSGIAAEKEVTATHHERGVWVHYSSTFPQAGERHWLRRQAPSYIIFLIIIIIIINIIIIIIKWRRLLWYLTYRRSNTVFRMNTRVMNDEFYPNFGLIFVLFDSNSQWNWVKINTQFLRGKRCVLMMKDGFTYERKNIILIYSITVKWVQASWETDSNDCNHNASKILKHQIVFVRWKWESYSEKLVFIHIWWVHLIVHISTLKYAKWKKWKETLV